MACLQMMFEDHLKGAKPMLIHGSHLGTSLCIPLPPLLLDLQQRNKDDLV